MRESKKGRCESPSNKLVQKFCGIRVGYLWDATDEFRAFSFISLHFGLLSNCLMFCVFSLFSTIYERAFTYPSPLRQNFLST